jgi:hypothetical protein
LAELQELHNSPTTTTDLLINGFDSDDQQSIITQSQDVNQLEWILLATAIDRISFILFCIVFIVTAISYIHVNSEAFLKDTINISSSTISENMTTINYF